MKFLSMISKNRTFQAKKKKKKQDYKNNILLKHLESKETRKSKSS